MPLYTGTKTIKIESEQYDEMLKERGIDNIQFKDKAFFSKTFRENSYSVHEHIWSQGDKLYKLAHKYFGDQSLFWLIGIMNNKPTDAHYKYGDVVYIPIDYREFYRDVTL